MGSMRSECPVPPEINDVSAKNLGSPVNVDSEKYVYVNEKAYAKDYKGSFQYWVDFFKLLFKKQKMD